MEDSSSSVDEAITRPSGDQALAVSSPLIRPARVEEVAGMLALFADEVKAGRMLPRDPLRVANEIGDWLVAEEEGQVVGCVSLVFFNEELCEVRSLAVHPGQRGKGLGVDLIRAAVDLARKRGMHRVLTLTRAVGVFERAGFVQDHVARYPEKVWRDCAPCPFRERCDEIALIYPLDSPGSGNGAKNGNGNGHNADTKFDPRSR